MAIYPEQSVPQETVHAALASITTIMLLPLLKSKGIFLGRLLQEQAMVMLTVFMSMVRPER